MAVKTTLEQLEEVQAAITFAETGQDVTTNGRRVSMGDLATLYKREEMLLARYNREQSGGSGPAMVYNIPRRD